MTTCYFDYDELCEQLNRHLMTDVFIDRHGEMHGYEEWNEKLAHYEELIRVAYEKISDPKADPTDFMPPEEGGQRRKKWTRKTKPKPKKEKKIKVAKTATPKKPTAILTPLISEKILTPASVLTQATTLKLNLGYLEPLKSKTKILLTPQQQAIKKAETEKARTLKASEVQSRRLTGLQKRNARIKNDEKKKEDVEKEVDVLNDEEKDEIIPAIKDLERVIKERSKWLQINENKEVKIKPHFRYHISYDAKNAMNCNRAKRSIKMQRLILRISKLNDAIAKKNGINARQIRLNEVASMSAEDKKKYLIEQKELKALNPLGSKYKGMMSIHRINKMAQHQVYLSQKKIVQKNDLAREAAKKVTDQLIIDIDKKKLKMELAYMKDYDKEYIYLSEDKRKFIQASFETRISKMEMRMINAAKPKIDSALIEFIMKDLAAPKRTRGLGAGKKPRKGMTFEIEYTDEELKIVSDVRRECTKYRASETQDIKEMYIDGTKGFDKRIPEFERDGRSNEEIKEARRISYDNAEKRLKSATNTMNRKIDKMIEVAEKEARKLKNARLLIIQNAEKDKQLHRLTGPMINLFNKERDLRHNTYYGFYVKSKLIEKHSEEILLQLDTKMLESISALAKSMELNMKECIEKQEEYFNEVVLKTRGFNEARFREFRNHALKIWKSYAEKEDTLFSENICFSLDKWPKKYSKQFTEMISKWDNLIVTMQDKLYRNMINELKMHANIYIFRIRQIIFLANETDEEREIREKKEEKKRLIREAEEDEAIRIATLGQKKVVDPKALTSIKSKFSHATIYASNEIHVLINKYDETLTEAKRLESKIMNLLYTDELKKYAGNPEAEKKIEIKIKNIHNRPIQYVDPSTLKHPMIIASENLHKNHKFPINQYIREDDKPKEFKKSFAGDRNIEYQHGGADEDEIREFLDYHANEGDNTAFQLAELYNAELPKTKILITDCKFLRHNAYKYIKHLDVNPKKMVRLSNSGVCENENDGWVLNNYRFVIDDLTDPKAKGYCINKKYLKDLDEKIKQKHADLDEKIEDYNQKSIKYDTDLKELELEIENSQIENEKYTLLDRKEVLVSKITHLKESIFDELNEIEKELDEYESQKYIDMINYANSFIKYQIYIKSIPITITDTKIVDHRIYFTANYDKTRDAYFFVNQRKQIIGKYIDMYSTSKITTFTKSYQPYEAVKLESMDRIPGTVVVGYVNEPLLNDKSKYIPIPVYNSGSQKNNLKKPMQFVKGAEIPDDLFEKTSEEIAEEKKLARMTEYQRQDYLLQKQSDRDVVIAKKEFEKQKHRQDEIEKEEYLCILHEIEQIKRQRKIFNKK